MTYVPSNQTNQNDEPVASKTSLVPTILSMLLGLGLIYLGLYADTETIEKFNFFSWQWPIFLAIGATLLFLWGARRVYLGFKENALDDYDQALGARFMRMTFFLAVSAWVFAYVSTTDLAREMKIAFFNLFKFGVFSMSWVLAFVGLAALGGATIYFVVKWAIAKFLE